MSEHRIYKTSFSKIYPMYVQKAERKDRSKNDVDRIICWLIDELAKGKPMEKILRNDGA